MSLLPAVLLHLSLDGSFAPVIASGYGLSAIAIGIHFWELLHPGLDYQRRAILLITVGFAILTGISVAAVALQRNDSDRRAKASRIFGAMCAALVAMSFVHLGSNQPLHAWSSELLLHHAGIPLALFVLLGDYRFVLLDAFVRFLANVLLAGLLTFAVIRITFQWISIDQRVSGNPLYSALLLVGVCLLLIAFALLRSQIQQWLTRVVFRRPDLNKALHEMQSRSVLFTDESSFLDWAAGRISAIHAHRTRGDRSRSSLPPFAAWAGSAVPRACLRSARAAPIGGVRVGGSGGAPASRAWRRPLFAARPPPRWTPLSQ